MLVSLVIATYNRMALLPRTLPALIRQDLDPGLSYEIRFVDDGSTDETPSLIARAAASPGVVHYRRIEHTGSPAAPRNVGLDDARGDVIVFVDDDVVPDSDFVRRHAEFHRRFTADEDAALGRLYLSDEVRRDPMSLFHSFPYAEAARARQLSYLFFWTCNVSLKAAFAKRVGRFDEDAGLHPLEDMECGYRLMNAGMRLQFLQEAAGCHVHQMLPDRVSQKGRRTGRAQSALIRRVPDLALKRRFGILTADQPALVRAVRVARRAAFRMADNPLTRATLRRLGATNGVRSAASDAYYYLAFRRAVVAGFLDAEAERVRESRGAGWAGDHRSWR